MIHGEILNFEVCPSAIEKAHKWDLNVVQFNWIISGEVWSALEFGEIYKLGVRVSDIRDTHKNHLISM